MERQRRIGESVVVRHVDRQVSNESYRHTTLVGLYSDSGNVLDHINQSLRHYLIYITSARSSLMLAFLPKEQPRSMQNFLVIAVAGSIVSNLSIKVTRNLLSLWSTAMYLVNGEDIV